MERPPVIPTFYYKGVATSAGILMVWMFIYELICMVMLSMVLYGVYHYTIYKRNKEVKIDVTGKAIFITGCDTGIGHELALTTNDQGFVVFAGCLDPDGNGAEILRSRSSKRIHIVKLDVTNDEQVEDSLQYVKNTCKESDLVLWGLVNNAGIVVDGLIELLNISAYKQVGDINLYGVVRVTKAFLPLLRQSKGRIMNVSSERGIRFPYGSYVYCMSKTGVEAFSDSLRLEMSRFGVRVSIIEPGHFGIATSIVQKPVIDRNRKLLETEYENSSNCLKGVKEVYCQHDINSVLNAMVDSVSNSSTHVQPLIAVMSNSLIGPNPEERYLVAGTNGYYDPRTIICRMKPFLPDSILDIITGMV
ncbi:D-beta-hydroxybutyrate dehydrogenase, mitochondrial [Patella vulgata]|uniref:D-beta-hydroxybutyrate dehydrogenase, mitochondrial n=1 Tax=Patella vulgata TaxID=6465 RepID=UPI00217F40D8|nr:D-beta-hydroxybutyrate dehydrogenase, mitochondrial [Patella vulgata]